MDVIERVHLNNLTLVDLKYYTRRNGLPIPLAVTKDQIIDIIIGRQAKVLIERTKRALSQVTGVVDSSNFETVDPRLLEPHISSYSSAGSNILAAENISGSQEVRHVHHSATGGKEPKNVRLKITNFNTFLLSFLFFRILKFLKLQV